MTIIRDAIEEIVSEDESDPEVEEEEEQVAHPKEGELLVIHQNFTMQARKEEEQRDNICHTRCNVHGKDVG